MMEQRYAFSTEKVPPFSPLPTFDKTLLDGRPIIEGLADYDNDMLKGVWNSEVAESEAKTTSRKRGEAEN
jgi:hypothetical protein